MRLAHLAQLIADLYFQDYPSDEEFFDIEDFKSQVSSAYAKLLNDDYQTQKLINRQDEGFSIVSLSPDILRRETITLEKEGDVYVAKLKKPFFVFPFDSMATAIQSVSVPDHRCNEFIKVSIDDRWKICQIKQGSKNYYSCDIDKIVFERLACKDVKEVSVLYAPAFDSTDNDFIIPDTRSFVIQTMVLQVMFAAKQGRVIDMSNDSNNNAIVQTETDQNLLK